MGAAALLGGEIGAAGGLAGIALGAGIGAVFGLGAYAIDSAKYNAPKARAKRRSDERLLSIANEAGYGSYEAFAEAYSSTDGNTPEDNYFNEVSINKFGYNPNRSKPLNTEELLQAQTIYDTRVRSELAEQQFQRSDDRGRRQQQRSGRVGTMGMASTVNGVQPQPQTPAVRRKINTQ